MGTIKNFEDLKIWNLARELINQIYSDFKDYKDYVFMNQITSAAILIMNNISEGSGRNSNPEFRKFLSYSKGSAAEVRNMYYIAEDLSYVSSDIAELRRQKCQRIIKGTASMISYLKFSR
ncbi:MAG TPA: four helix bundle protein [Bacteroidales bacterium]|nr:four helix bundle protein [Bacteroidales bacterium]HOK74654.1 four helix bundle protein [Bacteroidales bacterium]HOM41828.1 four helix bundle protein [Bacteroidales bacterium]HPP93411.1 four helix bundle protein [Bacteroidales bacterium]